jgi:Fe-S cluster assembly protein SufD
MTEITPIRTPAESAILSRFPQVKASLPGNSAVASLREQAFGRFSETGLPHRRIEKWKYTDLRGLMREAAPLAAAPSEADLAIAKSLLSALPDFGAANVTVVNGRLAPSLSDLGALPSGVAVTDLGEALGSGHPLVAERLGRAASADDAALALNAAFVAGGAILTVAAGVSVERPIAIRFVTVGSASAVHPRALIDIGKGASVTLIETHLSADGVAHQANEVVEIFAGDETSVEHVRLNAHGDATVDVSSLGVVLGGQANLNTFNFVTNPAAARHQVFFRFAGEHSTANVSGASLLNGKRHADTTLFVDHAVENCASREMFAHVLDGQATGVFQGMILVRPEAQKTDGKMMSRAVLLSDDATMNNKPELEIYADDVACGHGATVGALDEDLLFYLRARGLPKAEAEALMLAAFVGESLESIAHEGVRETLEGLVEAWLKAR